MKLYVASILGGLLAGAIYALVNVRSPAPPAVALLGLFGMLLGEQGCNLGKRLVRGQALTSAWVAKEWVPNITGVSPAQPQGTILESDSPPAAPKHEGE